MTREQTLEQIFVAIDGRIGIPKHHKMARSPFLFLRGASSVFYNDIQQTLLPLPEPTASWPHTNIMGDCHIENFGFFTEEGSFGESLIFAPNDFDDACFAPASWDLLRFCVSLLLIHLGGHSIDGSDWVNDGPDSIRCFLDSYWRSCQKILQSPGARDLAATQFSEDHVLIKAQQKAHKRRPGGSHFHQKSALGKACDLDRSPLTDRGPLTNRSPLKFRAKPEKFQRLDALEAQQVCQLFAPYMDDQIIDVVARLNAGTGSANLKRYYLLVGPSSDPEPDKLHLYHIVEAKQQRPAAPLRYFHDLSVRNTLNPAHLTAMCQRRMQRNPDLILDEVVHGNEHWLVRSRHHARYSLGSEDLLKARQTNPLAIMQYAQTCGETLALAHSRGDLRSRDFEDRVVATLPSCVQEFLDIAGRYADQVENDWRWLKSRIGSPS